MCGSLLSNGNVSQCGCVAKPVTMTAAMCIQCDINYGIVYVLLSTVKCNDNV